MKEKFSILCVAFVASQASMAGNLSIAFGALDARDDTDATVQLEYLPKLTLAGLRPRVGLFVTEQSAGYAYAGLGYPWSLAERWVLSPSISVGYYHQGGGPDLGQHLQFYSQLQLRYLFSDTENFGIGIGHVSNANLADTNPGANSVYLSYASDF